MRGLERVLSSQGRCTGNGFGRRTCTHSHEQRLCPVRWQLYLMIVAVRHLSVGLHHYINCVAPRRRSSSPIATNTQLKRSRLPAWCSLCQEPWTRSVPDGGEQPRNRGRIGHRSGGRSLSFGIFTRCFGAGSPHRFCRPQNTSFATSHLGGWCLSAA